MAHNKKLKTSKITSFSSITRKKNMMANSRLHQNRIMSEKGLFLRKFNQKKVPLRVKDDDETDAGFNDLVSPNHPNFLLPY